MMYASPPRIKSPTAMPTAIPMLAPFERGEDEWDTTARGIIFLRAGERVCRRADRVGRVQMIVL
ncbi:hypothetical protein DL95DRAFT_390549 [Leptodontidium sp. 2 PMI_412]|nr:hypothetical protein DL95DRAFT_390549 [Leptodontidium sp. 2 PMI_412]